VFPKARHVVWCCLRFAPVQARFFSTPVADIGPIAERNRSVYTRSFQAQSGLNGRRYPAVTCAYTAALTISLFFCLFVGLDISAKSFNPFMIICLGYWVRNRKLYCILEEISRFSSLYAVRLRAHTMNLLPHSPGRQSTSV
jgi:hypothetical protein